MNSQGHQSRTASFDGEGVSTPPLLDETEIVDFKWNRVLLYTILLPLVYGVAKAIFTYMGNSIIPTTIELIVGGFLMAANAYIGLHANVRPKVYGTMLHVQLSNRSAIIESILLLLCIPWLYGYVEHWKNPICEGSWAALYILGLFLSAPPIMIYISRWRPLLLVSGHMQRKSDLWCGTLITAFALMHLAAYFRIVRRMGEASCWGELMILVTRFPASVVFASGFYASDNPYVLYLLQ